MRLEGDAHLAAINVKQHALIAHLREPSVFAEVNQAATDGPVKSKSALFMLDLMGAALRRLDGDPS